MSLEVCDSNSGMVSLVGNFGDCRRQIYLSYTHVHTEIRSRNTKDLETTQSLRSIELVVTFSRQQLLLRSVFTSVSGNNSDRRHDFQLRPRSFSASNCDKYFLRGNRNEEGRRIRRVFVYVVLASYSREMICPGRRGVILRLGANSPLSPLVSSCFVLAAVLVSADDSGSVGSVSPELEASGSSEPASSWLAGTGGSVALRRGNNGDLLDASGTEALVVVFGCTCSLFRLRSLFSGLTVVERVGDGLVSAGACQRK